ncbi:DUF6090 family protein [Robiginitalea aurantiaca]|uniref:DUF6090 family protein n=1 Tax=Robiginitalea aurantiaca TaxID=3056915 RepID=A0ABT7WGQ0_9FLAO|nr:DUF6090 family protein [Robiginitalea aurantiaca]MDM9632103.1 DUF6090 family protein [Robiginitalea aurantiaca]
MITLFRKLRLQLLNQNKISRYLLYALGEILLVVIGILIALQVNTWNEERQQKAQVSTYARALIGDLQADINSVKRIAFQAERAYVSLDSLANYVRNTPMEELSNLNLMLLSGNASYRPFSWNRATFQEMKSSGILSFFQNDSLVKKMVNYEAMTNHLDLDYEEDARLENQARAQLGKVVNRNYDRTKGILRITTPYKEVPVRIIDFSKTDIYRSLKKQDIDFINADQKLLRESINNYIQLKNEMSVRYSGELPSLISDAEQLIDLLEQEIR